MENSVEKKEKPETISDLVFKFVTGSFAYAVFFHLLTKYVIFSIFAPEKVENMEFFYTLAIVALIYSGWELFLNITYSYFKTINDSRG